MPVPVVVFPGRGGSSFGTSVSSSRQRFAAFGTPDAAKPSSGSQGLRIGGERLRRFQRCRKRFVLAHRKIEHRSDHQTPQRGVIRRLVCGLRDVLALGADRALDLRQAPFNRREIGRRGDCSCGRRRRLHGIEFA